jgi:DNA invertase Pin-like site-specific DNA recombinase/predicted NAD-dependent protein-ADP-ribosyltransferase YbiA (DUF1768 family)
MQVDENDIPIQRKACKDFIDKKPDWVLAKEYYEKGVSGFKKKSEERDVLMEVQEDAIKKKFDVLLVFMFDRLGRRDDETPFVLEWFVNNGIEVWSVKEGQQRFDSHTDKLVNYIRFWQASGESLKTSIRVDEAHKQMVEKGEFRGGVPPYGYKLIRSGKFNKKGKEVKKMVINNEEAEVVRTIYDLALSYGMGGQRIAQYLNEKNTPARKGSQWGSAVVNYMLRNPIYKGYMAYGKTTSKQNKQGRVSPKDWLLSKKKMDELAIIPEQIWNKVQLIRHKRTPDRFKTENLDYGHFPMQTKSPLLFTGFIRCGCCGSSMSTGYSKSVWTTKDGEKREKVRNVYKCVGKTSGNVGCIGPYTYSSMKIEGMVLDEVYKYLDALKAVELSHEIEKLRRQNVSAEEQTAKKLQKAAIECEKELDVLRKEIAKSILGKSSFKPDLLNAAIEQKNAELEGYKKEFEKVSSTLERKRIEYEDMVKLRDMVPVWREEFENAAKEVKKVLLAQIIDEIIVYPEKVDIKLKMRMEDFIKSAESADNKLVKIKRPMGDMKY